MLIFAPPRGQQSAGHLRHEERPCRTEARPINGLRYWQQRSYSPPPCIGRGRAHDERRRSDESTALQEVQASIETGKEARQRIKTSKPLPDVYG